MRNDYKIQGQTAEVKVQVEKSIAETLASMEKVSGHTVSELVNTAIKRFISAHKDFLPHESQKAK
jgi:hypothetical protein